MPWPNRRLLVESLERRRMLSGTEWFEDSGQQPGQNSATALGDLDGDDQLDAFVGCYAGPGFEGQCSESSVWLNDGQGTFSRAWSAPATNVLAVALADLDADGDLDAFVGRGTPYATAGNQVLLNDGEGNFTDTGQKLGQGISWDVRLADVDNDGDADAVVANMVGVNEIGGNSPSQVWLNDGHGNFDKSDQDLAGKQAFSVALGDLDGDGDLDAYLAGGWNKRADYVLINDGSGNFSDSGQMLGRRYATSVQLGDLDADGDLDAFLSHGGFGGLGTNQPNEVWINDGDANFTNSGQRVGSEITTWAALGDMDGDGDLDVFYVNGTHNASAQTKRIWLNDGGGNFSDSGEDIGVPSWGFSVSLGDLDGDGDLDAFVGNLNRPNEVWFNVRPAPGDANGDGQFDQHDIVLVLQSGKYNTGEPADFSEGDWNQDGVFNHLDIVSALQLGKYLGG